MQVQKYINSRYVSHIHIGFWEQKLSMMEERRIGTFWSQDKFLSLFFSGRRTLKFLKMQCNPTNKNNFGNV